MAIPISILATTSCWLAQDGGGYHHVRGASFHCLKTYRVAHLGDHDERFQRSLTSPIPRDWVNGLSAGVSDYYYY